MHDNSRTTAVGNILSDRNGGLMLVEGYHRGAAVCLWYSSSGKAESDWEGVCGEENHFVSSILFACISRQILRKIQGYTNKCVKFFFFCN